VGLAEFFYYLRWIAMLPIHCFIHRLHFLGGDLVCQTGKRGS
jgi:hypothetical protein